MPILFQISIEVNSGSVGRIADQIGQVVMSNGWESYITYARNHLSSKSKVIKIGTKWDVYWHGVMTRLFDRHCLSSTRATRKLIKQIETIRPDIIQLHHIHGYYINMKVLFDYLSTANIPVVWVFHDCWSLTGHCAYFDYVNCDKWKTQCSHCIQKTEYPASVLMDRSRENYELKKRLFNSVDNMTIVPVSNWLAELVRQSYLNKHPIQTIHNGINLSLFSPQTDTSNLKMKLGIKDEVVLLGVASTWDQRKGLKDFIVLNSMIPNDWKIVLVGLSKIQIEKLPLNMIGVERTESVQQLAALYTIADVFINPTWEDTFPTTNLEALACGTPIVSYRTGGSVESVSEDTGFVVEKGDVEGVVESVKKILKLSKGYYSFACRNRAVTLYDKDKRFEDYIMLYNKLLML